MNLRTNQIQINRWIGLSILHIRLACFLAKLPESHTSNSTTVCIHIGLARTAHALSPNAISYASDTEHLLSYASCAPTLAPPSLYGVVASPLHDIEDPFLYVDHALLPLGV